MSEERVLSDLVWTPERGIENPEVRGISWENFLLSDDKYLGKWRTDSGVRVTPETALQSTVVLACCRILAETISGLPLHVYRRNADGSDEIAKEIPLYKILTFRPNEWQTKAEFFEQIVMNLTLWGNSYTRIRSGQYGSVSSLDNLHPSRMDVERLENGRLRYSYTDPETGRLERYTQDQIMHVRWTPEQDGIKGMVPVEIAREAIGLARACEQHAARFWANSARPGVVLQTDGTLTAEAAERLRENWERLHKGADRAYKTAILTGGLKAQELGMTNESSQFVASRDFQTAEICRVYRIAQHLIQGTPGGDLEVQGQEFVTYTLMPWLNRIESSISRSLIYNDDEYYARFDVRGLLRANSTARASFYSTMINLGVFTINDVRRMEGMKTLGSIGDHHFVPMNTQTLEDATKPKPEAPPGGMPPGGGGGGDGPPPPVPGGPPSMSEVKTGKAPVASPKGEASKPKAEPVMEDAVEESSSEWEDAIEARAFCATGEGNGVDNSCGVGGRVDNSWKKADREYSYTPGEGKSPITGGEGIKSLSIESPKDVAAAMKNLKVKSLTDVVAIGGGLTRGAFTSIASPRHGEEIHVMSEVPVDPDDEEAGSMSSTVSLGVDPEGKRYVDYGTMHASSESGEANFSGEDAARMSSILLEKFPESLAAAEKAGLDYAKTFAMGDSQNEFKGYRLWPQFGFDAEIYADIRENIPKEIVPHDDPITIQQLISTPAGDKWWNENGESMGMTLNLKDKKSDGYKRYQRMAALSKRLKKRNEGRSLYDYLFGEERAFCATGPGGGVKNDCGSKDGGGEVTAADARAKFERYRPFKSVGDSKNSEFIRVPSDEEVSSALTDADVQQSKIGANRELANDTPVALRIDIPAWTKSEGKTYVVTVHEGKNPDNKKPFGPVIGYDSVARLSGPVRFSANDEDRAQQVAEGKSKTPLATVNGNFSKSRDIPSDIDSWTPVGYDPQKAVYFYDKRTGREVVGGTDAVSVGNTVFTRQPSYGPRNAKTHYRSADEMFAVDSWGIESRGFCPTGEGGGIDNSCGGGSGASGSPAISIEKLVEKIASNPDGFTLDPLSADSPPDGIMVSEFQNDTVRSITIKASEIDSPSGVKKLSQWVSDNADMLVGQADRFVGGWRTGEDFYIDVSTRFPPEKAAEALEAGRKAGQLAVFNLGTFKETWVQYDRDDDRKPADYDKKFAKARKDSQEKQVYDPDTPAIQDEDWAKDLSRHGKTTVRAYNFQSEEDASHEQTNPAVRCEGQANDHRDVSRDASILRAGSRSEGQEARPSVVRRRSGNAASPLEGSAGDSRERRQASVGIEDRGFCPTGEGGGIDNSCGGDSPTDSFGNIIGAAMRSPSSTMGGGGGVKADTGWKKTDSPSVYSQEQLKSSPPARSLSGVNTVAVMNGRTLAASLRETGVTLDQAAKVCGNLSPESNIVIAHGDLKEITEWVGDPSLAGDPQPRVTVVSKQPFGGVEDAVGTVATLERTEDDELLLNYTMFSVAPGVQRENPVAVARGLYSGVVKSINEAEKIGVSEVGMLAAGSDSNDEFKGYRIWPRLGFDGVIPRSRITPTYSLRLGFFEKYGSNLSDAILSPRAREEKKAGALTIQSLYDTKEGQRWWEENGGSMGMSLRIGDDSDPGWQRFKRISERVSDRDIIDVLEVEWRCIREEVEQRGFCATGEGGGIDNSCGSGSPKMAPDRDMGSPAAKSMPASVRIESSEKLQKSISTIGASSVDDIVALGGGNLRGSQVAIAADPEPDGTGSTYVQVITTAPVERDNSSAETFNTQVSISVGPNGREIGFESLGLSGHGQMTKANEQKVMSLVSEKVIESIATAEKLDFDRVTTFAIGDSKNGYKGYRLWPQFGFDGDIPRDIVKKIPPELILASKGINPPTPGSTSIPHDLVLKSLASRHRDLTIQELLKTREGDRWWDKNGDDIVLKLDLKDKSSLGYQRWEKMKLRLDKLKERNQTRSFFDSLVEERGFCPTGEGGGIDNSCGSGDGGPTDAFGGKVGGFSRTGPAVGGRAPVEQVQRVAGTPVANPAHEAVVSPPTARSSDGKTIESTSVASRDVPGDIYSFGGREYVSTVTVGQYLTEKQAQDRGGVTIDSSRPLTGDNRQYVIDAHVQQVQSATDRGIVPVFYTPEERQRQIEEYSAIEPRILGGRANAGFEVTPENAEFMFRAVQAVTSSNASPEANMKRTQAVLDKFFNGDGRVATSTAFGVTGQAIIKSLSRLQTIVDRVGLDDARELFVNKTMRSGDIDEFFREVKGVPGDKNAWKPSSYLVDQEVPVFSVFGPKFGTFFANNTGQLGHLTADIWATRTFGRVTGELIQEAKPDKARSYAKDVSKLVRSASVEMLHGYDGNQLLESLRQVASTGEMTDIVRGWAGERLRHYSRGDFTEKRGTGGKLNKLAKNIVENDVSLMGTPGSGKRRANMIDVYAEVSKKTGMPVAYAQDVLWQDEQDAYAAAGAKTVTAVGEPSFYSDVIAKIARDPENRFPRAKKEKRSVDESEEGYLDDFDRGGRENLLWFEATSGLSDDEFADLVIKFAKNGRAQSRSAPVDAVESAKSAVIELRSAGTTTIVMPNAGREGLHVMGFDADIPPDLAEKLPESLSHCKTLVDLHVTSEGRSWWEQNGRDIDVSIDLDGVQGRIFDSFAAEKRWEDIIEEGILDDYGNA